MIEDGVLYLVNLLNMIKLFISWNQYKYVLLNYIAFVYLIYNIIVIYMYNLPQNWINHKKLKEYLYLSIWAPVTNSSPYTNGLMRQKLIFHSYYIQHAS